jgi:hypothetical protein
MKFLSSAVQTAKLKLSTIGGLVRFLWINKMWWLIPMVVLLIVFFLVIIFAQSSPLGPFIYTIF